jgi:hypothetical protein
VQAGDATEAQGCSRLLAGRSFIGADAEALDADLEVLPELVPLAVALLAGGRDGLTRLVGGSVARPAVGVSTTLKDWDDLVGWSMRLLCHSSGGIDDALRGPAVPQQRTRAQLATVPLADLSRATFRYVSPGT